MRFLSPLLLILCLAACQRGSQNNADAVRQGVVDHLVKAKMDPAAMDLKVSSVQFNGDQADAVVTFAVKANPNSAPMNFNYHLERQANKWVVVGQGKEAGSMGSNPHGGAMPPAAPGTDDPHGGMPPAGGSGKMPSPQDLPPAKK